MVSWKTVLMGLLVILLVNCAKDINEPVGEDIAGEGIKIMPLGASRVEGDPPDFFSYRYELWKLLIDQDVAFDLVGSQEDEYDYNSYAGQNFDGDHEGHSGAIAAEILNIIESRQNDLAKVDITLISSPAGNDALSGGSLPTAVSHIKSMVDLLLQSNPNMMVIIEKMAPGHSDIWNQDLADRLTFLHEQMGLLVDSYSSDNIILIDMATGFSDDYLSDEVHYNEAGAKFIANRYYDLLQKLIE
jgi:lysophospholipase L1-like esterase